jgi:hypothetical protein
MKSLVALATTFVLLGGCGSVGRIKLTASYQSSSDEVVLLSSLQGRAVFNLKSGCEAGDTLRVEFVTGGLVEPGKPALFVACSIWCKSGKSLSMSIGEWDAVVPDAIGRFTYECGGNIKIQGEVL